MPGFVREVGVGGHAVDVDAHFLEFSVVVGQVAEFRWAHKGECRWEEHKHGPLALEVLVADRHELAVLVSSGFERDNFGIDKGNTNSKKVKKIEKPGKSDR